MVMVYKALKSQADYVVRTDESGREVLETSKSTIIVPAVKWNGRGIKWFDDKKIAKENC